VDALTKSLVEIERQERGRVVKGAGKGGKLGVLSGLAKVRIEELTENLSRVRSERDSSRGRIEELEAILKRFKEEYNPNFNDEGVKQAVKAWENYATQERPGPDDARDRDLDEILKPDSESAIKWEDFVEGDEESDIDVCKSLLISSLIPRLPLTFHSVQIRSIPPYPRPRLGGCQTPRSPRHHDRKRHPRGPQHRCARIQRRNLCPHATHLRRDHAKQRPNRAQEP